MLERGHCLTLRNTQRNHQWQSQFRSRCANDDQEHSFIHSTTHMIHITPSLKRMHGCSVSDLIENEFFQPTLRTITFFLPFNQQTCQTSFTNGNSHIINRDTPNSLGGSLKTASLLDKKRNLCPMST